MHICMIKLYFATLSLVGSFCFIECISCKDESGSNIDWFINYKFPKLPQHEDRLIRKGEGYGYLKPWWPYSFFISELSFGSRYSMLGKTLEQYYNAADKKRLTYLFYSSDTPDGSHYAKTSAKGVLLFDDNAGIWLIHTINEFPNPTSRNFPEKFYQTGQMVLCLSFNANQLNEIGKQLLYYDPDSFYLKNLNVDLGIHMDDDVRSLFSSDYREKYRGRYPRITKLISAGGQLLTSVVKAYEFGEDIYANALAPELKTKIYVKSCPDSNSKRMEPSCDAEYTVQDVTAINTTTAQWSKTFNIAFPASVDNSRWVVSTDSLSPWFCISDIDREIPQIRSGGAICSKSIYVWTAFKKMIGDYDTC